MCGSVCVFTVLPWSGQSRVFFLRGWQPQRSRTVARLYSFSVSAMKPRPGVRRFNLLHGNAEHLARTLREDGLLEAFETNLSAYIAQASRRRLRPRMRLRQNASMLWRDHWTTNSRSTMREHNTSRALFESDGGCGLDGMRWQDHAGPRSRRSLAIFRRR
jgi:hypothetical protein